MLLALNEDELYLLAWPRPKSLENLLGEGAQLRLARGGSATVDLELEATAPIYPGCGGDIMRARVKGGTGEVRRLLSTLPPRPERRNDEG